MIIAPFLVAYLAVAAREQRADPVSAILDAFRHARVVALGENHGHLELHDLVLRVLADPRARASIDDVSVEWGNSLYQPVMDRYIIGDSVPWDSVTMTWRNTAVSPNRVWDASLSAILSGGARHQWNASGSRPIPRHPGGTTG